jgi:hypothetical protein
METATAAPPTIRSPPAQTVKSKVNLMERIIRLFCSLRTSFTPELPTKLFAPPYLCPYSISTSTMRARPCQEASAKHAMLPRPRKTSGSVRGTQPQPGARTAQLRPLIDRRAGWRQNPRPSGQTDLSVYSGTASDATSGTGFASPNLPPPRSNCPGRPPGRQTLSPRVAPRRQGQYLLRMHQRCVMKVPFSISAMACRSCSCVFITIGPYHATGSSIGLPETNRKRIPSSPACTAISSPRSNSTSE